MPTITDLRQQCRENFEPVPVGTPFEFEVASTPGGKVRVTVKHHSEWCAEVYQSWQGLTLEVDARRWLAIAEAMAAKCREVVAKTIPPAQTYEEWANGGGPNECEHGIAAGLHCTPCAGKTADVCPVELGGEGG